MTPFAGQSLSAAAPFVWSIGRAVSTEQAGGSFAYYAYKAVAPHAEPLAFMHDSYAALHLLARGVQATGPNLTPVTLETGLLSLPEQDGPYGLFRLAADDRSAFDGDE